MWGAPRRLALLLCQCCTGRAQHSAVRIRTASQVSGGGGVNGGYSGIHANTGTAQVINLTCSLEDIILGY